MHISLSGITPDNENTILGIKWKKKTNASVGTVLKSNGNIVERGNIYTINTQIHDRSLSWLGTGTSI